MPASKEFYNFYFTLGKVYISDKWYWEFDVDYAPGCNARLNSEYNIMFDVSQHKLEVSYEDEE